MVRKIVQWLVLVITNANIPGFWQGKIYKGLTKSFCVPGLNCYSCPGALGACPIGSLQGVLGSIRFMFSFYVVGTLVAFGIVFGRFVCGFLCPFGLIQECIHKIPFFRIRNPWRWLKYGKYGILAVFVVIMPLTVTNWMGMGAPAFCQYICPAGTLMAGLPLLAVNTDLRTALDWIFQVKLVMLVVTIVGCLLVYRFFCRYLCPLGAIYSLFNSISVYQLRFDKERCNHCNACSQACKMGVNPSQSPMDGECIRCGDCVQSCRFGALSAGFTEKKCNAARIHRR